ncbi:hypothetical protein PTUN_a2404 [Pseudoalteromonas tunicata]|uniref:Uncharacterized protein n=1 Tax=Pseudoalteromonas tunicata D2 TaxID=87626 RepID=A4CAD3_9GAMM|nr:hypothetical protein PTUN_a2404 [Pseudoalteromonas tunicata]EAR28341.1 hypothetical protein PTD2_21037 [Pseudoalteromonas tunicata D2]
MLIIIVLLINITFIENATAIPFIRNNFLKQDVALLSNLMI